MKITRHILISLCAAILAGCVVQQSTPTPTKPILPFPLPTPTAVPHKAVVNTAPKFVAKAAAAYDITSTLTLKSLISTPGAQLNLYWNPSTDPDTVGYNLYYGTVSGTYTNVTDVGSVTNFTVLNLRQGVTYFFKVTAYGFGGESLPSNEISYSPPIAPPDPVASVVQVNGVEYAESNGAFWQPTPTNVLSSYTNNSGCSIVYSSELWKITFTNDAVLYASPTIVNTNWTQISGTNSGVHSVAIGNPLGAPQPTSILVNSFIVAWSLPRYDVYVTGNLTEPWTYLTNTTSPYIFVSRQSIPSQQFFKIVPAITNYINLSPQN